MERFLGFARGFRKQFARLEKAVGALLVADRRAFLTGGVQSASSWLIETFPLFGRLWDEAARLTSSPAEKPAGSRRALDASGRTLKAGWLDHIWWKVILPSASFFQTYQT